MFDQLAGWFGEGCGGVGDKYGGACMVEDHHFGERGIEDGMREAWRTQIYLGK